MRLYMLQSEVWRIWCGGWLDPLPRERDYFTQNHRGPTTRQRITDSHQTDTNSPLKATVSSSISANAACSLAMISAAISSGSGRSS